MNNKEQKPRKGYNNYYKNKKTQGKRKDLSKEDRVVYVTKTTGPEKKADWQLKLQAISDCFDKQEREDYKELVEKRYNELWHKQNR